ncbi:MAG TPA: histidine phosphatase family protein [Dehalococcoidia bacterium]|jgi:alpha-ribazole phosphatase|nr:histidine phosphatase family protein [Dehalococcoidia bacterium]
MTEIILIRHGETQWNVAEVFRGRIDIELNETGIKQAELLAARLSKLKLEAIYSSPLKRALKTAEIIARYQKLEVSIAPGLVDLDFGKWQGLAHQEVKDKYQELYATWLEHPERVRMPEGESLDEVRRRAMDVVNHVTARHRGTVVLVSHRVVNKVLICALLGLDNSHFWKIKQDTCGLTIFTYEGGEFILTKHNDTCHLRGLGKAQSSDF